MSQIPYIKDGQFMGSVEVQSNSCNHKNSESTGDTCSDGCCDEYKCKDCGKVFLVELPD